MIDLEISKECCQVEMHPKSKLKQAFWTDFGKKIKWTNGWLMSLTV